MSKLSLVPVLVLLFFIAACEQKEQVAVETIKAIPVENLDNVIAQESVEFDQDVTSDENGAIKIVAEDSTTVRLYEFEDIDIESARLIYRAKVKTENFQGTAFLEMWCSFGGLGEFFSRDMQTPITGSTDWTTEETAFMLQEGQNPNIVKLNLVVNGTGTIWIDDTKLTKGPLNY